MVLPPVGPTIQRNSPAADGKRHIAEGRQVPKLFSQVPSQSLSMPRIIKNYKKTLEGMSQSLLADGPTVKTLGALNQQVAVLVSHIRMMDKKMAKYLREHS